MYLRKCARMVSLAFAAVTVMVAAAWAGDTDDLIKLARSGVEEEVLLTFIQESDSPFDLDADEIVELRDLGVSSRVIAAAMKHRRHDSSTQSPGSAGDRSAGQTTPPPEKITISYFYETLSPYGSWVKIDGEWYWRPNAIDLEPGWTPYCTRGRWVYTDWGWAWVSDYSWGWAPFHYGRWVRHRLHGWVWLPDVVWGPAWVAWRKGEAYFGWAPLPPRVRYVEGSGFYVGARMVDSDDDFGLVDVDFVFVPAARFCDPRPWVHVVPRVEVTRVYRQTTYVPRSYTHVETRIVNVGVPVAVVSRVTNRSITPIHVRSSHFTPDQPVSGGAAGTSGVVFYRPSVSATVTEDPVAVQARIQARGGFSRHGSVRPTAVPATQPQGTSSGFVPEAGKRRSDEGFQPGPVKTGKHSGFVPDQTPPAQAPAVRPSSGGQWRPRGEEAQSQQNQGVRKQGGFQPADESVNTDNDARKKRFEEEALKKAEEQRGSERKQQPKRKKSSGFTPN